MGTRILVVEDDDSVAFPLQVFLERSGYDVDLAADKARAEELLAGTRYALVLADLRLRGAHNREGLELLARVRIVSPGTRTILLTAAADERPDGEAFLREADLLIRKPQPLPVILTEIRRLIAEAQP
jgi:two-component system response regulator HydG